MKGVFFWLGCKIDEKRNATIAMMSHFTQISGREL